MVGRGSLGGSRQLDSHHNVMLKGKSGCRREAITEERAADTERHAKGESSRKVRREVVVRPNGPEQVFWFVILYPTCHTEVYDV